MSNAVELIAEALNSYKAGVYNKDVDAFAAGHAFLSFTAESSEGAELRSLNNRITLVMKKAGSSWKVIHEHTSAPVDFNTMKAWNGMPTRAA